MISYNLHKRFHAQLTQKILNGIYPRCSVCMMNMGSNSGYFAGQSHMMPSGGKTEGAAKNLGKKITPFGSFFSWCQTCRHGGHCDHMEGTFFHIKYLYQVHNVCFIKIRNKHSSVLLLCLLRIFMKQTL